MCCSTSGLGLMGTLDEHTSLVELAAFMVVVGSGVGMLMQNLVLVVQNAVAAVRHRRRLVADRVLPVTRRRDRRLRARRDPGDARDLLDRRGAGRPRDRRGRRPRSGGVPDVHALPAPVAQIVEHAYGVGVAEIFLVAAPLGFVALCALAMMREVPLGSKSGIDLVREEGLAARGA